MVDAPALVAVRRALERADCDPRGGDRDFTARCPAHHDRTPSLHVSEGADRRALLCCFAGCANESIVATLGLTLADLFPRDPLDRWPRPDRDRVVALAGRVPALIAEGERTRLREADVFMDTLVQVIRDGRGFAGSLTFSCPECERGHAWLRRDRAGLVVDCSDGCDEHLVLTALARLTETQEAA